MLQTYQPEHAVLKSLKADDYQGLMQVEMEQREAFGYPPYTKLIKVDVKHIDAQVATEASRWLADQLRKQLGNLVLGPQVPSVARIKNRFIQQIVIKVPRENAQISAAKFLLQQVREAALAHNSWRSVRIDIIIDPN
jgi:primosomal protein N' (replication factor Y)